MKGPSLALHERIAENVRNAASSWMFFGCVNAAAACYMLYQQLSVNDFDPYPFTFLNLILAVFTFDLEILIMIAQRAGERYALRQERYALGIAEASLEIAKTSVATLDTLQSMQEEERRRDAVLHEIITRMDSNEHAQTDLIRGLHLWSVSREE